MAAAHPHGFVFGVSVDEAEPRALDHFPSRVQWQETGGLWLHLQANQTDTNTWLEETAGLPAFTRDALSARETRPRSVPSPEGLGLILRGINTNTGSDPDDMVAMRIWCDGRRLISMRHRKLQTPRAVYDALMDDSGAAKTVPQIFEALVSGLVDRIADIVDGLDDQVTALEIALAKDEAGDARSELSALRLRAVNLRRYLAPQREVISALAASPPDWIEPTEQFRLSETADRLTRCLEEIDSLRERAIVLKDDASNQIARKSERTLYVLSIISAIFLPLGFLTGLLGINVGGLPGVESASAFFWVCVGMVGLLIVQLAVMRWLKWL